MHELAPCSDTCACVLYISSPLPYPTHVRERLLLRCLARTAILRGGTLAISTPGPKAAAAITLLVAKPSRQLFALPLWLLRQAVAPASCMLC